MQENWKDVVGYEGSYQVSNLGRVKSLFKKPSSGRGNYSRPEIIMKLRYTTDGYKHVLLYKNSKGKRCRVHRLVAETFIPNPDNKPEVHHINHIRDDNRVENLEWVTPIEQMDDHWYRRLYSDDNKGENNAGARATRKSIVINDVEYVSQSEARRVLGISNSQLRRAIQNNQTSFKSKGKTFKLGLH